MNSAEARYAIYYAPPPSSPLDTFGASWLGNDVARRPPMPGFAADRLAEIVESARHYGFHATLKPPFILAPGSTADDLDRALKRFTAGQTRFAAPPLELAPLGGFLALTLSAPCPSMAALAERCVRDFDAFRMPPSEAELAQRRGAGLTPLQDELLRRWGYPYVMGEFRFHMTLSSRLDSAERERLRHGLAPVVAPLCAAPFPVDGIALFVQPDRASPFRIERRYVFGGTEA
jgi:putative phosphonate metabolism protein